MRCTSGNYFKLANLFWEKQIAPQSVDSPKLHFIQSMVNVKLLKHLLTVGKDCGGC